MMGGLFFPNQELKISVNGRSIDDEIDLGEAFNLKEYNLTFDIGFDWRFAKKWKYQRISLGFLILPSQI